MGLISRDTKTGSTDGNYVNGQVIDASEVNTDFNKLYTLVNGSLDATNLAAGSVGTSELAATSVTTAKIGLQQVTAATIADYAVIESKINTGAVTETKLGALAVTEAKIATGAVTQAKLGALAVARANLGVNSVHRGYGLAAANVNTLIGATVTTLWSLTAITSGGLLIGFGSIGVSGYSSNYATVNDIITAVIYRDAAEIARTTWGLAGVTELSTSASMPHHYLTIPISFIDQPGAGTYTYTLKAAVANAEMLFRTSAVPGIGYVVELC